MKKVRTLVLAAIMVVGLSAASVTVANAACGSFEISCGDGSGAEGVICGPSHEANISFLVDFADVICN